MKQNYRNLELYYGRCFNFRCRKLLDFNEFISNCFCNSIQDPWLISKHWCNDCWKELHLWIEEENKRKVLNEKIEKQKQKKEDKIKLGLFKNKIPEDQRKLNN